MALITRYSAAFFPECSQSADDSMFNQTAYCEGGTETYCVDGQAFEKSGGNFYSVQCTQEQAQEKRVGTLRVYMV
jgi:hypothetical protein